MVISKESIEKMLGSYTISEIASEHGCDKSTIKRHMKKHGLKQSVNFVESNRLKSASLGGKALSGVIKSRKVYCETDMKCCPKCKTDKPLSVFYIKNNKNYNYPSTYCKKCTHEFTTANWIEKKKKAIEYKGGKCVDCTGIFHYAVFEFHHLNPEEKEYNWTKLRKFTFERIVLELDKCVLLCANCHRMRHVND